MTSIHSSFIHTFIHSLSVAIRKHVKNETFRGFICCYFGKLIYLLLKPHPFCYDSNSFTKTIKKICSPLFKESEQDRACELKKENTATVV